MSQKMFKGLCILGALNFLFYVGCRLQLADTPSSGPEGIGSAFLAMASLLFAMILTGFGLNRFYVELLRKSVTRRTILATLSAASPLLAWLFFTALRFKN
jgi:hypothetical protein